MRNLIKKIRNNPLKALVVMVLIYPVLPLALLASWFLIIALNSFLTVGNISNTQGMTWMITGSIWFVGGPAGLIGGIMILLNKQTIKTLLFLVYGAISYSIIAVVVAFEGLSQHPNVWIVLHSIYLSVTLVVILIQIIRVYKNINLPWRKQVV